MTNRERAMLIAGDPIFQVYLAHHPEQVAAFTALLVTSIFSCEIKKQAV